MQKFKSRTKARALSDPWHPCPYFGSSGCALMVHQRSLQTLLLGAWWLLWTSTMQQIARTQYSCLCPQWFWGAMIPLLQQFFNSDQLNSFIANHQQDAASQYAAKHYNIKCHSKCCRNFSKGKENFSLWCSCLVITCNAYKWEFTIRRPKKHVYKIYQINSEKLEKCSWSKFKTRNQQSFLQYSF